MKVQDILTDESKWTQDAYARDFMGQSVPPGSDDASCWCLVGAIAKATGTDVIEAEESTPATVAIRKKLNMNYFHRWNDNPNRTFAEVRALIEELDI